jgi:hypothetical protein
MTWVRGGGALLTLVAALLGAPSALLTWGRLPPGWSSLARPDDGSLLLGVLTVVGWVAWAAFAASTLTEAVRILGPERRRRRIPLLGGLQHLSAGLLLAVLALAPHATPEPSQPVAAAVASPAPPATTAEPAPMPVAEADACYVVADGDDLWAVAAHTLGDGARWRELVAANPDALRDPVSRLAAGTRLTLPADAVRARRVTVREGDTLSGLARDQLGAASRWPRIARANRDLIEDPDHIEVGWKLVIPGAAATTTRATPERSEERRGGRPAEAPGPAPRQRTPSDEPAAAPSADAVSSAAAPEGPPPAPPAADADEAGRPALPMAGTLGTLAAAALIGVVETRRFLRSRERPVGRRLIPPGEEAAQARAALGRRQAPDRLAVLDASLRAIGRHCHRTGRMPPELTRITVGTAAIWFEWAAPAGPPPAGLSGTATRWVASLAAPPTGGDHPCAYPLVTSLGSTPAGDLVLVDAERSRVLGVSADDAELRGAAVAAMAVELACAPWSAEARLVVAGRDARLVALAGGDRVELQASVEDAVARARLVVARRASALAGEQLGRLRVDPDRADAVAPIVFCFLDDVGPEVAEELDDLLRGPAVGVAAVLPTATAGHARWRLGGEASAPTGHLDGESGGLLAHTIPEPARTAVAGLLVAADDPRTAPAPWWGGGDADREAATIVALPQRAYRGEEPVDIVRLVPAAEHPQVLLIGPVDLRGAPGPEPARSRQQLIELCAWMLTHPGSTATAMAAGLAVAESTRRSNLSRLRAWLGNAPDGKAYLPEAYSGRILLHPGVSSDWHRLELLLRPGVDMVGDSTLVAALELVRGAPVADAAPSQWHWAEELRTDISSSLRDVGVVLTDRALAHGDIDLARWAAARALVAAPEDELLLCARLRTEHRAGNATQVERIVNQITRQARMLGVDLMPETVALCQQVVEGRPRARA